MAHDLQHMEKFCDYRFYAEQVGLLCELDRSGAHLLTLYDAALQADIEHCYADMNACSIHMFGFLKSKFKIAEWRRLTGDNDVRRFFLDPQQDEWWSREMFEPLLQRWQWPSELVQAATLVCTEHFTANEAGKLRQHWHELGNRVMQLQLPLLT
jgi:hypothetical protein